MLKIKRFLEYRKCSFCGEEHISYRLERINKKSNDYICDCCQNSNSYSAKNNNYKGKKTQTSFSFEFETGAKTMLLYELKKYNFIPCSDCTIRGYEWKSPIYYNKKSFHAICRKLDKFAKYVDNGCGTHLHVGTLYKGKIAKYEHELFQPILNLMVNNQQQTIKFWGRFFNSYCVDRIGGSRYNAFNTRSSVDTLEFRLLKFINAEQYIKACDFCIDTTRYINYFIGRDDFDCEKAKKIGKIIADKYKEVTQNVQTCTDE